MYVASLYGVSGSSTDKSKKDETEKLLAAAILRAASFKDVPYLIGSDLNCNPASSDVLNKAIEKEAMYDIVNDYFQGDSPPTYRRKGIEELLHF